MRKNLLTNLEQYLLYTRLKDSVYSQETKIKITNLETQRALELKDKQIELDKLAVVKKRHERIFYISGIMLLLIVVTVVLRNYYSQRRLNVLLRLAKGRSDELLKRSDELLVNILPVEVADELKTKGRSSTRHFDNVTVLFTDFVNFTAAGERMSPEELIDELHNCFHVFDEITGKYGIEKIKR